MLKIRQESNTLSDLASSITVEVTDSNEMFSHVKKTMLKSASQRILAVDYTKFEIIAFSKNV